ncbi:MAG: hypothetical protein A2782_02655 [Candidatus Blackburnbacteria bacterium RIFCSPHIGHO2_01_FULL_43_15b]|uniref:Uncharacterized protein n=1 Tax=Candidatus Blackburnbacteria bacterium RIFCSPHIGHO2_01_FULL_43_15b TaxID=1797513 RepID=A0A1G1V1T5_9BACT|nr:MAG: hypothetical protein A2782_02655 [Candidatus Blackburnbacteria bacterium RIFCSPHIGHO2_01_FULL_43_15b]
MSSIQSLTADIEFAQNLGHVAQSYSSLAASKLAKIRTKIEGTRTFFSEVAALYHAIREVGARKYKIEPEKNSKTASVLLTSNQRFYGSTNTSVTELFLSSTTPRDDLLVIGHVGNELIAKPHKSFVFQKDIPTSQELSTLAESLAGYARILVFYPLTKSILEVVPQVKDVTESLDAERSRSMVDVTASIDSHPAESEARPWRLRGNDAANLDFLFEPEIKKMIEFFKDQATTLLVGQAFLEAELAREAARLVAMDTSQQRAKEYVQTQTAALRNLKNIYANKHLLEGFLGVVED